MDIYDKLIVILFHHNLMQTIKKIPYIASITIIELLNILCLFSALYFCKNIVYF